MAARAVVGGGVALGGCGALERQATYIEVTGIKEEDEQFLIEVIKQAMGEETSPPTRREGEDQLLFVEAINEAMEETPAVIKDEEDQPLLAEAANEAVVDVMGEEHPTLTACEDDRETGAD